MKKFRNLLVSLFLAVACLSMSYSDTSWDLLDGADYQVERLDSLRPTLIEMDESGEPMGEAFSHWQCFPTDQVLLECAQEGGAFSPCYAHLIVKSDSGTLDFQAMTVNGSVDSNWILNRWRSLLEGQTGFCVYAAVLKGSSDSEVTEFDMDHLKTAKGSWDSSDEGGQEPAELEDNSDSLIDG